MTDDYPTKPASPWSWVIQITVLIFLFGVVFSLFAPTMRRHRYHPMMQSLNSVHQIGIAITNYATSSNSMLPQNRYGAPGYSWRLELCPQLDRTDIAREYCRDAAWDSNENELYTSQWLPVMTSGHRPRPCKDSKGRGYADFGLISGPGTVNPPNGPVTLDFISKHDGLASTLLVGECSALQLIWTEPRDPDVSREKIEIATVTSSKPTSGALLSSYSRYGVCVLFGDGSGKQLSKDIDPKLLAALCTVAGEEDIRPDQINR